jgi:hypothetical protein
MTLFEVFNLIEDERARQAAKWTAEHSWGIGDCSSAAVPETVKVAVLTEEVGEVARAVLDRKPGDLRGELVQVAAVACAWLEGMASPAEE